MIYGIGVVYKGIHGKEEYSIKTDDYNDAMDEFNRLKDDKFVTNIVLMTKDGDTISIIETFERF